MLQPLRHNTLIISFVTASKGVLVLCLLIVLGDARLDRCDLLLVVDETGVVLDLRSLGEITALAETHRDLPVDALHVLVHGLGFFERLTVHLLEDVSEAIIDGVNVVGATILHRQRFLQFSDTRRLSKLLL